jgi:hypothetical protein
MGPVGTPWPDGWQSIGYCDSDSIQWGDPPSVRTPGALTTRTFHFEPEPEPVDYPLTGVIPNWSGATLSFRIPLKTISPPVFRLMFGRRHPKLRVMHCDYGRRMRARRRRGRRR